VSLCQEFGGQAFSPHVSKQKNANKNITAGRPVNQREKLLQVYQTQIIASKVDKLIVQDGANFICIICREMFASKRSCVHHIDVHRGRTKCTICERVFGSLTGLKYHVERYHKL
jgi:hypothetical protein